MILAKPATGSRPSLDLFDQVEHPIPVPREGEALVRVLLINIHAATFLRIASGATKIGATDPTNYACAVVVQSRDPAFAEGDVIHCQAGWQEYQIIKSSDSAVGYPPPNALVKSLNRTNSQWCYVFRPEMVEIWSPSILMEMFGTSGMTAYFGMRECGPIMPQDKVFVAGASGSVGSLAAQLAKIAGAYVVGLAGGEDRCQWVVETTGIDGCIDYRATDLRQELSGAFPTGIDVFSDGIGGYLTEVAVETMNPNGRLLAYGSASLFYGDDVPASLQGKTFRQMVGITDEIEDILRSRNIKSEAWIVDAFYHERLAAEADMSRLLLAGKLKAVTNVVDGFDALPQAIVDMYGQSRAGKLQVQFGTL